MNGQPDGELVLTGGGQRITGWTAVSVTRGVERIPGSFDVRASVSRPKDLGGLLPLNAPVVITIGGHVVLTGYLERIGSRLGEASHEVTLIGRGRCCDLVDTSALIKNQTRQATTISTLARALVEPYAGPIKVLTPDGDGDNRVFTGFTINLGESPYELIERIARYEGLLVYEDADGNLVLSRVGRARHASGFEEGRNVQGAELLNTVDGRFSKYIPLLMSSDVVTGRDGPGAGGSGTALGVGAGDPVLDPEITRHRPHVIVSEQGDGVNSLAVQRARWEAARRAGRSHRLSVVADSWLDSAGQPWTPNRLATVKLPSLGLDHLLWIITDVHFRRDERGGTTAQVTLMPPEALTVQPTALDNMAARNLYPGPGQNPAAAPPPTPPKPSAPNAGAGRGVDTNNRGVRVNLYPPANGGAGP